MAAEQVQGGKVTDPDQAIQVLCAEAGEWTGMASIHFADGESLIAPETLDKAIQQLAFSVTKINTARMKLIEARELQAMDRGS